MCGIANSNLDLSSKNSFIQASQEQNLLQGRLVSAISKSGSYIIQSVSYIAQSILSKCIYIGSLGRYTLSDLKNYLFTKQDSSGSYTAVPPPPPPPLPTSDQLATLRKSVPVTTQTNYSNDARKTRQETDLSAMSNPDLVTLRRDLGPPNENNPDLRTTQQDIDIMHASMSPSEFEETFQNEHSNDLSRQDLFQKEQLGSLNRKTMENGTDQIINQQPIKKTKNPFVCITKSALTDALNNLKKPKKTLVKE